MSWFGLKNDLVLTLVGGFAISLAACGSGAESELPLPPPPLGAATQPIIGGAVTKGHPAVGVIGGDDYFCTGFLISPNVVVTAAHCFGQTSRHPSPVPLFGFYTGPGTPVVNPTKITEALLDAVPGFTKHEISKRGVHPQASLVAVEPYVNDVGYVVLKTPVAIQPITLPAAGSLPAASTSCTAVGFGRTGASQWVLFEKKRATVSVLTANASTIDVDWGNGIGYLGDSGSPLLCGGKSYGVFTWVYDLTNPSAPVSYTPLDVDWIEKIVKANPAPAPTPSDAGALGDGAPADGALLDGVAPDATIEGGTIEADASATSQPTGVASVLPAHEVQAPTAASPDEGVTEGGCTVASRAPASPACGASTLFAGLVVAALGRRRRREQQRVL